MMHGHMTVHHCKLASLISINVWCVTTVLIITRIGVMSCGTAGPLGSVPGMWNHLQGDQVN